MGVQYGPAHRGLMSVQAGTDDKGRRVVLAKVKLPTCVSATAGQYVLHPSVLDCALQAAIGFSPENLTRLGEHDINPVLPFALDQLEIFSASPATAWVVLRSSTADSKSAPTTDIQKLDIDICDEAGRVCVRLRGFTSRVLVGNLSSSASLTDSSMLGKSITKEAQVIQPLSGTVLLTPRWDAIALPVSEVWPATHSVVLLVGGTDIQRHLWQARYPQLHVLATTSDASIEAIVARIALLDRIDHVVWLSPESAINSVTDESLITAQLVGVIGLYRLIKALLSQGYGMRALGWSIVTWSSQAMSKTEHIDPTHASVHGLVGSLAKEYEDWKIRLVDLSLPSENSESPNTLPLFDALLSLPADPQGNAWAYRAGEWYRQRLITCAREPSQKQQYRQGGVYVVIGGAGGIGEVISEYLISRYQAQVIWIGRRELDQQIQKKLDRLSTIGPIPTYLRADAADREALEQAYQTIIVRHGKIHGLVHAAIALLDKSLAQMDEARFAASLKAKVDVSVRMAQVFANEQLDFVLFFSSLQSFTKLPGQSNYAAGCIFEDTFAHQLAHAWASPIKIMNWGYWGSVGIVASDAYRTRMAQQGVGSIEPPEGMAALEQLLGSHHSQLAFLKTTRQQALGEIAEVQELITSVEEQFPSLAMSLSPRTERVFQEREIATQSTEPVDEMHRLLIQLMFSQLQSLGMFIESHSSIAMCKRLIILPTYHRWLDESIHRLASKGYLRVEDNVCTVTDPGRINDDALWSKWREHKSDWIKDPRLAAQVNLVEEAMRALPEILAGKKLATDVMFPNSSMRLVEGIYKNNPISDYFNSILIDTVVEVVEARLKNDASASIRILEIGAGTGGTSEGIFKRLKPYEHAIAEYRYTDISTAFLMHAEEVYGPTTPYLKTQLFNVEQPLGSQEIEIGGYDLAIASNVLHATQDIRHTLRNVKASLKKNGILLFNEISGSSLFAHLTFGLLEGWWLHQDEALRVPGSPALLPETWRRVLESEGFQAIIFPAYAMHDRGQQIIAAQSDGLVRQPHKATTENSMLNHSEAKESSTRSAVTPFRNVLRAAEALGSSSKLAVVTGVHATERQLAEQVRLAIREAIGKALKMDDSVIRDEVAFSEYGVDSIVAVSLVKRINECFDITLPTSILFDYQSVERLSEHIVQVHALERKPYENSSEAEESHGNLPKETIAVRTVRAMVPLYASAETERKPTQSAMPQFQGAQNTSTNGGQTYYRVMVHGPGDIDSIEILESTMPAVHEKEVQIAVHAFSLNFGDLLCVKGLYPTMPPYPFTPGFEVSGIVIRVGKAVTTVRCGERVVAFMGKLLGGQASLVNCDESQVFSMLDTQSFEEACALPAVAITMIDAFRKAALKKGERILIQTAAGGTGLIAVQLAKYYGAEIYATAGSRRKLDYLRSLGVPHRINYLETDFEQEIHRLTQGQGVDVVINTLPSEAIQKGLNCLASGGRYIEIAMTALKAAKTIDLSVLNSNQTFFSVDLRKLGLNTPATFMEYRNEMMQLMQEGVISPTISEVLPFSRIKEAYRHLENRENIGKIVITIPEPHRLKPLASDGEDVAPKTAAPSGALTFPAHRESIAVIGMSGRFATANTVNELWECLAKGVEMTEKVSRWDLMEHPIDTATEGIDCCYRGGFLQSIEQFDASFFNISGLEATYMDPQQRLFLEEAWKALEDAGYAGVIAPIRRCGVYVGCAVGDYSQLFDSKAPAQAFWGNAGSVIPARISYYLNLQGPAIAVDTACSSSLVAMHLACQSLWNKETDLALAGGVHVQCTPEFYVLAGRATMLSPTGRCHAFDYRADGFVPGEGVGVVVLKRESDALAEGDHIYGVIRGSGVNQDGATNGITAPSALSQERLEREVYETFHIHPEDIQMMEAHGTGTILGDPIEWRALTNAFGKETQKKNFCAIGSIKTNIGHTATAAGVAGVIKVLLALKHKQIPASLHFETGNSQIDFENSPFYVNTALRSWQTPGGRKRCAAVSSFGFSGTNAHMVLEEAPTIERKPLHRFGYLIVLSARTAEMLKHQAKLLVHHCEADKTIDCGDISYTLLLGRKHFAWRLAIVVCSTDELIAQLNSWLEHEVSVSVCLSNLKEEGHRERIAIKNYGDQCIAQCLQVKDAASYLKQLRAIAELFVDGYALEFDRLYAHANFMRVSLPTFTFSRERYWVEGSRLSTAASGDTGVLHPLLHSNVSNLSELRFRSEFTGNEFFFNHHRVRGRKVLPGVAYLEMARVAVAQGLKNEVAPESLRVALKNIVWLHPIVKSDELSCVHTAVSSEDSGEIAFEIYSTPVMQKSAVSLATADADNRVIHAQGRAALQSVSYPVVIDVEALQARCVRQVIPAVELYAAFYAMGIEYGPAFQGIEYICLGEGESLAKLRLPSMLTAAAAQYALHPSLLDSAMQASISLKEDAIREKQIEPALLFALESLEVWQPCPTETWVWVRRGAGSAATTEKVDLDIFTLEGIVCVQMRGVATRVLKEIRHVKNENGSVADSLNESTLDCVGAITLVPRWDVVQMAAHQRTLFENGESVLVIGGTFEQRLLMQQSFPRVRLIETSPVYDHVQVTQCLESIDQVAHVIWIAPKTANRSVIDESLINDQESGVLQCFRIFKALLQLGYGSRAFKVTIITIQAQNAQRGARFDPTHAGVHGLIGSVAKEYPAWSIRLIDLEEDSEWPWETLLRIPANKDGNLWLYRQGEWFRQCLLPYTSPVTKATSFRQGGVYVLIGGAGAIGEAFSEYVIRTYQAQVIWIGRRALEPSIQGKIERLAVLGPTPRYLQCDATDRVALAAAYEEIKAHYPRIHGVVHSTLVLLGSDLAHMDEARFKVGLAAKVDVSVRLAQVFDPEHLDWILFFSSIQAFEKTQRQSNYAAGCTFTDAYAQALSQACSCPVKIMNWGYWSVGNIEGSESFRNWLTEAGFGEIEPAEGMAALEQLLSSPLSQQAFLKTAKPQALQNMSILPERLTMVVNELPLFGEPLSHSLPILASKGLLDPEADKKRDDLERMLGKLLYTQLHSLGLFDLPASIAEWKQQIKLPSLYDRWLKESLDVLAIHGYVTLAHGVCTLNDTIRVDCAAAWEEWKECKQLWREDPDLTAQVLLVEATLRALPDIFSSRKLATDIVFPHSSLALVEGIYKHNRVADYFNAMLVNQVAVFIAARLRQDPNARISLLEIGAGTGGTSSEVFKQLTAYRTQIAEYCYTDLSKAFLLHAQQHYAAANPYLTTAIFNVERSLAEQSIAVGSYDLVIAANVLHATSNIRVALRNAKAALKANGVLLLNETVSNNLFAHLTFGLLEGWWKYEDCALRVPGCPALSSDTWRRVLAEEGFHSIQLPTSAAQTGGQQIIVAYSDGLIRQPFKHSSPVELRSPKSPRTALSGVVNHEPIKPQQKLNMQATLQLIGNGSTVDDVALLTHVKQLVIEQLAETLKVDLKNVDAAESFADYGLDSIMGVRTAEAINQRLSIKLTTTSLFDYPTVNKLAAHIVEQYHGIIVTGLSTAMRDADDYYRPAISAANAGLSVRHDRSYSRRRNRPAEVALTVDSVQTKNGRREGASLREPIAIIGMSGRYAKSDDIQELWEQLANGKELTEAVTRWDLSKAYAAAKTPNGCQRGGFLKSIDRFDPLFFNISPIEATYMDPQQRLFLEECWKTLEDAGYAGMSIEGRRCGVYVGYNGSDYQRQSPDEALPAQAMWGGAASILSARIAYYLDLKGPAITIDTACSSSLVAIHLACQGLRTGETDLALAGGVYVQCTAGFYVGATRAGMLSPSGRCHTFDDRADGFVPGEGVGVVLLKRLSDALADHDHIHAVIRGSGINQDGATNGITAPSALSQERLEREVYDNFGIHPEEIQMVEAHGTGTKLGDPIEYQALTKAFRKDTDKQHFCALGSIKTNIGHTTAASGVAGLIKCVLALQHKQIPPSLHYEKGNAHIDMENSPFYVNTALREWEIATGKKRCAAVSSFGMSGTNAHMVIEEAPTIEHTATTMPGYLIVLSARSVEQLKKQVEHLLRHCEDDKTIDCGNLSFTLLLGRKRFDHRLACVARTTEELTMLLTKWVAKGKASQVYMSSLNEKESREQGALKRYGNQCIEECRNAEQASSYLERLATIAELYCQGYQLNFEKLFADQSHVRICLATYPFAKERYWIEESSPRLKHSSSIPEYLRVNTSALSDVLDALMADELSIFGAAEKARELLGEQM